MENTQEKAKEKISDKLAEAEYNRFVESYDFYINIEAMDEKKLYAHNETKGRIIRQIQRGNIAINNEGLLVYKCKNLGDVTFGILTGADLVSTDGLGENQNMTKNVRMWAGLTKLNPSSWSKLVGEEVPVMLGILNYFL